MAGKAIAVSERYLKLIKGFPLRPLRSDEDLDAATQVANRLATRDALDDDEQDYLDVLSGLIEAYEDDHYPIPAVSGVDLLRFLIESRGVTQSEVARETGLAVSTINEILSGKRRVGTQASRSVRALLPNRPGRVPGGAPAGSLLS